MSHTVKNGRHTRTKGSDIKFCSCRMCRSGKHHAGLKFLRHAIRQAVRQALRMRDDEQAEAMSKVSAGYTD